MKKNGKLGILVKVFKKRTLQLFDHLCNCPGMRNASKSIECLVISSFIDISGGYYEYSKEVSSSEDSFDEDGNEGGCMGGGIPPK